MELTCNKQNDGLWTTPILFDPTQIAIFVTPDTSLNAGYKASHPKMPLEKNLICFSKLFFFFCGGRVDFVCFQAFRPNKVPFYNFFIAGRSALKKKRCSNQCNSRPISTTGCQQMCRDDKTSPKKRGMPTRSPIFQPNLFLI